MRLLEGDSGANEHEIVYLYICWLAGEYHKEINSAV